MFDDYLWKSYVYQTTFSNVKYQDLCATINPSKIKYCIDCVSVSVMYKTESDSDYHN